MIPIGALDYGKTRSCKYLKEGNFTIKGDQLVGFRKDREKKKVF
jgi:hypothetical protein